MDNFDVWNNLKKNLDIRVLKQNFYFYEGEIWWCSLGKNIRIEIGGKGENFSRPVLVVKSYNKNHCLVIPATTSKKVGKYYFPILIDNKEAVLITSQIRAIDSRRLLKKITRISRDKLDSVKNSIF